MGLRTKIKESALLRPKDWSVYKTYKIFRPLTRKLIWLSIATGSVVLTWCSLVDLGSSEWWHRHSYIPNVWAGLTGFLIGAPVGLVVLATFTTEREEAAILNRVNSMSELAWKNFLAAFNTFYNSERYEAVTTTAERAKSEHDKARKAAHNLITFIRMGRLDYLPETKKDARITTDLHDVLKGCYEPIQASVQPITKAIKDHETIDTQWSAVVGAWQTLDQFIRLQRLEQGLDWFFPKEPQVDAEMRKWLSRNPNPLTDFAHVHGYATTEEYGRTTMVNAVNAVKNYSLLSEGEIGPVLGSSNHRLFGYNEVDNYQKHAREASFFLERLAFCISRINESNWPASATKPAQNRNRN